MDLKQDMEGLDPPRPQDRVILVSIALSPP